MKRLVITAALFWTSAAGGFAQKAAFGKEPFAVSFEKLSTYLRLMPAQMDEVEAIHNYFLEKQNESLRSGAKYQKKKMHEAIYGNLKLMKKALTAEQYRKYVMLINVTNNNNRLMGTEALPDVYLAEK